MHVVTPKGQRRNCLSKRSNLWSPLCFGFECTAYWAGIVCVFHFHDIPCLCLQVHACVFKFSSTTRVCESFLCLFSSIVQKVLCAEAFVCFHKRMLDCVFYCPHFVKSTGLAVNHAGAGAPAVGGGAAAARRCPDRQDPPQPPHPH